MNKTLLSTALLASCFSFANAQSLKEAYRDYWRTGVSVNQWEVKAETKPMANHDYTGMVSLDQTANFPTVVEHFGWIVPENCMKMEVLHPQEGIYDFTLGDQLVEKARQNGLEVIGHCLIWHSQCAPWFFTDENGKQVSADVLKKRMKEHIYTVLGHYRGKVKAWDVVNEAFEDDGSFRRSKFYEILGEDFIPLAFQYAHEADPNIELYYNDYSMNKASKIDAIVNFFRPLIAKGLPIDAIGCQAHMILEPNDYIAEYDHAIKAIASLGIKAQFTELDLSVLPNPYGFSGANISDRFAYSPETDPYTAGIPAEKEAEFDNFWIDFYKMLINNKESILRVNFWCTNDANSWRNDFPIRGRHDYATLFDRNCKAKPLVGKLIELVKPAPAEAKAKAKGKTKKK